MLRIQVILHFSNVSLLSASIHSPNEDTFMSHVIWKAFPQAFTSIKFDSLLFRERWMVGFQLSFNALGMTPVIVRFSNLIIDE
jgi:hypothetical protein